MISHQPQQQYEVDHKTLLAIIESQVKAGRTIDLLGCRCPMKGLHIHNRDMTEGDLRDCFFNEATFEHVGFDGAQMQEATFDRCLFYRCSFDYLKGDNAAFDGCYFQSCTFKHASVVGALLRNVCMFDIVLDGANFGGSIFTTGEPLPDHPGSYFSAYSLPVLLNRNWTFPEAMAALPQSSARGTNFSYADLTNTTLFLDLEGAIFTEAKLTKTQLFGGTNLTKGQLTQEQWASSIHTNT